MDQYSFIYMCTISLVIGLLMGVVLTHNGQVAGYVQAQAEVDRLQFEVCQ